MDPIQDIEIGSQLIHLCIFCFDSLCYVVVIHFNMVLVFAISRDMADIETCLIIFVGRVFIFKFVS